MPIVVTGKPTVYGEGLVSSVKICLVGEAPGSEEVKQGRPFIGPSGSLLFRLLGNVGIGRHECYITNVVKEQPPGNDISHFIRFDRGRAITTPRYDEYEAAMREEIAAFSGNVIVAVGGVALWALCRKIGIMKWRGSILQDYMGRKVIPIPHPASAMRQYINTHIIAIDLRRVEEESKYPDIRLPSRHISIEPSYLDVIEYLLSARKHRRVAVDIEVLGTEISCISFAVSASNVMSIPFIKGSSDYFTLEQEIQVWLHIAGLLEDENIEKVFQNGVFDYTFIFRRYGIRIRPIKDTMVGQGIIYPDFPKGLDFITSIFTKEPYYKDDGKKWFKMGGSEHDFWTYNAKDSAVCLEALPRIEEEAERQGNTLTIANQTALIEPLVYMHTRGMRVDKDGLDAESESVGERIDALTKELRNLVGYDINPNSPHQIKDLFYNQKKERPYISRKTGTPTVDGDALKRLSRKGHKEAGILLEIRRLTKLKGTYLDVTLDKDNRLRCAFNPVGTTTGRLSSSEDIFGVGTNTQNLPNEFKQFVIADKDTVIFNIDLSQAENRVVAYIAPEPAMQSAFERGIDMHRQTAGLIFGKPSEEVSDEPGSTSIGGGKYSERFFGKKSNHSLNYDLGYKSFAFILEIPESDAKFIVDRFHLAYPGIRAYHAWVRDKLSKGRTLENPYGRKRLFLDRWGNELFKEAYAWIPQSTVGDKLNIDGILYAYYNQSIFAPIDLLNQVHDSMVFQCNVKQYSMERIADCIMRLKDSLEKPVVWRDTSFVIPIDLEMGISLCKETKGGSDMMRVKALRKVKIYAESTSTGLARLLHYTYGELRAAITV